MMELVQRSGRRAVPLAVALIAAMAWAFPASVQAQGYYIPPKLLKQGTFTSPIAGAGTVIVKVLVNADGSFKVQGVVKSTNKADEPAALEIANSSKYKPATRNTKPVLAFYDFSLRFNGKSVSSDESGETASLSKYETQINEGKYADAKNGLTDYLAAHPGNAQASLDLGAANALLKDYPGAVKAFDNAGNIPSKYAPLAGLAYASYATEQATAKNGAEAVAAATKAVKYSPTLATYNALGLSQLASNNPTGALDALQHTATMAANDPKIPASTKATIQANIAQAYLQAGDVAKATAAAAEAGRLDPSSDAGASVIANYHISKAEEFKTANKMGDAAAEYDAAAAAYPKQAVTLYNRAASLYLAMKPDPAPAKAKAEADKALAIAPDDAEANYYAGVSLADQGSSHFKDALTYLKKADAAAKATNNTSLAGAIQNAIKQVGGS